MNISPLIYFSIHHGAQIAALFSSAKAGDGGKRLVAYLRAIAPLLVKDYPKLAENDLLNDAIDTLENVLADAPIATHLPGYPDPTNQ